jgi:hypothetical protein
VPEGTGQLDETGAPRWIDSFPNHEAAIARAKELAKTKPGEYFIVSQKIGHKQTVKLDE